MRSLNAIANDMTNPASAASMRAAERTKNAAASETNAPAMSTRTESQRFACQRAKNLVGCVSGAYGEEMGNARSVVDVDQGEDLLGEAGRVAVGANGRLR
jgi:hypothetical protein